MRTSRVLLFAALVVTATVAFILARYGTGEEGLRAAIRATARLSGIAMFCAMAGFRTREALLALPVSHGAHYAAIVAVAVTTTPANAHIDPVKLLGGIAIYALMVYAAARRPTWALYVLWTIFLIGFAPRIQKSWIYIPIVALLVLALGIRLAPRRVESSTAT